MQNERFMWTYKTTTGLKNNNYATVVLIDIKPHNAISSEPQNILRSWFIASNEQFLHKKVKGIKSWYVPKTDNRAPWRIAGIIESDLNLQSNRKRLEFQIAFFYSPVIYESTNAVFIMLNCFRTGAVSFNCPRGNFVSSPKITHFVFRVYSVRLSSNVLPYWSNCVLFLA